MPRTVCNYSGQAAIHQGSEFVFSPELHCTIIIGKFLKFDVGNNNFETVHVIISQSLLDNIFAQNQ